MATVAGAMRATRTRSKKPRPVGVRAFARVATLLPLAAGMAAWALSLPSVHVDSLGEYGLPPALPALWYAAAGILVAGAALHVALERRTSAVTVLYLVGIVVVLFGTVPAVSAEPHYAWVYKHIGVTRFLGENHTPDPNVDIYNRWPGFFALTAVFDHLTGASNPVLYAAWAEVFFTLLAVFLVRGAVRLVVEQDSVADGAALLFAIGNWVAQGYFSPQALDFTIALAIVTLVLALGRRPERRMPLVVAILALDAAAIPTHQLSPYVVLFQVAGLAIFGLFRPRWILLPMVAMTVAYLVPNLGYIQEHFGLFTSLDPFSNAQRTTSYIANPLPGKLFNQRAGMLLSALVWIGAVLAFVRLRHVGVSRRARPFAVLAVAPFGLVLGQSYGGEAVLRVMLFSLPWSAALIAWALATIQRPLRRSVAVVAVCGVCAGLFIPAFFGQEELNQIPRNEVVASDYFDAHAKAGSVLLFSAPNFPGDYGARYPLIHGATGNDAPTLLHGDEFRHRPLGSADVAKVASVIRHYARTGYIVFSTTQTDYAHVFQLVPDGALQSLEANVATSSFFRLWYSNPDTRIYELVKRPGT
jgi:hypothetical protein